MRLRKRIILKLKDKICVTFILVFILSFIILRMVNKEALKTLTPYLENDMKKYALEIINNSIIDNNKKDIYNQIIITDKNNKGEIIGIDFDTLKVNTLLSNINSNILISLNNLESGNLESTYNVNKGVYTIPFYIFSNNIILRNLGFSMPFKIKIIGNALSNIKTDLTSYGINNALIKAYIEVNVNMEVILPFISKIVNIKTEVPVMMKIINGSIPEVYGGMYSVNSHSV